MGNRINDPASAGSTPTDQLVKRPPLFGETAFKSSPLLMSNGLESDIQSNDFKETYKYLGNGAGGIDAPIETWKDTIPLRQSNWEQFGNATARTLLNILPETIKQGSRMFDFTGELDGNGFENDNAIAQAMTSLQDSVNDNFKIYRENSDTPMDFGDFAYWAEQGSNLIQSAGAFALLGMATGGAGGAILEGLTGARKAGQAALAAKRGIDAEKLAVAGVESVQAGKTGESVGQLITAGLKKTLTNNNINGVTNAFLMNRAEGVGVAADTYQSVYEKDKQKLKDNQEENQLSDAQIEEQAKNNAAQAASYAYNFNRVNILLNLSSSFAFVNINSLGLRQSLEKVGTKELLKTLGKETGQEAIEEGVNYTAQKRAEAGDANLSLKDQFVSAVEEGSKDAFSAEGRESMLWGAIGGLTQTGFTRAGHYIKKEKNVNYNEAYRKHLSQIYRQEPDLTSTQVQEKAKKLAEDEVGSVDKRVSKNDIIDYKNRTLLAERAKIKENLGIVQGEEGDNYVNAKDKTDLFLDASEHLELDNQIKLAKESGNQQAVNDLVNKKFDFQVMRAMETGTLNTLEESLKGISKLTPQQAVESGLAQDESDTSYKTKIQEGLQTIKDLEKIHNYNQRYVNSRDITALDNDIYRIAKKQEQIGKEINPIIENKLAEKRAEFFKNYTNKSYVPYVSDNYFKNSYEDKLKELKELVPEQRTIVNLKEKELSDAVQLTTDDFSTDRELEQKFEFLQTLKKEREQIEATKEFMIKPETQKLLKEMEVQAKQQARQEYKDNKAKVKKEEAEVKAKAKQAKSLAKEIKKETTNNVVTPVSVEPDTDPVKTEEKIKEESTKVDPSTVVIKPTFTPNITKDTVIETVVDSKLLEVEKLKTSLNKLTVDQEYAFEELETYLNNLIKIFNDDTSKYSRDFLNRQLKGIYSLSEFVRKQGLIKNEAKQTLFKKLIQETNDLAVEVIDVYNTGTSILDDVAATKEDEVLSSYEEEEQNKFGEEQDIEKSESLDAEPSEEPIILSTEVAPSKLAELERIDRANRSLDNIQNLIQKYKDLGYPITSFDDLERQLYKMTSKDNVVKLRPQLIRLWNALQDIQQTPDKKVDPNLYRESDIISDEEYFDKAYLGNNWSDEDEQSVNDLSNQMIINSNELANNPITTIEKGGTNMKSLSSFNLAYLAKEYEIVEKIDGTSIVKQLQDTDEDGIRQNLDTRVLDVDALLPGTKLTFSPLRIGQTHSYYDKTNKVQVVLTRRDNDTLIKEQYYLVKDERVLASAPEELNAIDFLPIFISSTEGGKNPKRIPGLFLHTTDWVRTAKIAGTEDEVKVQQDLLRDMRNTIINNKSGKLLTTTVQEVSDGVFLTGKEKSVNNLPSKQTPIITVLKNDDAKGIKLLANKTKEEFVDNMNFVKDAKNGTPFMIVKNGKKSIALPLNRKKLADLEQGKEIKQTILKLVDVYLTPKNKLTEEQIKLRKIFKNKLKIDLNNIKDVNDYISMFINTENIKTDDIAILNKVIAKGGKSDGSTLGVPVFKFKYFSELGDTLFMFGRYGDKEFSLLNKNEANVEDRQRILNYLDNVLNDTYMNVNIQQTVNRKEVRVLDNDNNSLFIGKNYSDFLANNLFTKSAPVTITTANDKEKEIFTIQRTITIGEPDNTVKKTVKEVVTSNEIVTEVTETSKEEEKAKDATSAALDFLDDLGDMDSSLSMFALDEEEDSTFGQAVEDSVGTNNEELYSLENEYNFVRGINSNLLNSILNKVKFLIEDAIFTNDKISSDKAFDITLEGIENFIDIRLYPAINTILLDPNVSDDVKALRKKFLDDLYTQVENIKSNKDKIISRVETTIKKEGFFKKLTPQELYAYNEEVKERRRIMAETADKKKIERENDLDQENEGDESYDPTDSIDEASEEIVDFSEFDSDAMYVDSFTTLNDEVKSFFTRIRNMKLNKAGKPENNTNFFGIEEYVSPGDAYRKVQELLVNHPSFKGKTPTYENYIAILEKEQAKTPYLYDIVQKLKSETKPRFKKAFVKGMYKQYNNTIITLFDVNGNTRIINTDDSNAVKYSKAEWKANFDLNPNATITKGNQENPTKTLNPVFAAKLDNLYNKALEEASSKNPNTAYLVNTVKETFSMLGITASPLFYYDLQNDEIINYGNVLTAKAFVQSTLFKYSIGSIVGNPLLDLNPIGNIFESDIFNDSSFNGLANLLSSYNNNLYGSSSKDINNNSIYNISEMKNLVEAFFKNRDNIDWINQKQTDPYGNIAQYDSNKKYKTWAEQLVTFDKDGKLKLNPASSFSKVFEYYTFNGTEFQSNKSKQRLPVEKLSEANLLVNNLNMFLKGETLTENGRTIRTGVLPFFTMSDKKVPMYFKVPLENFDIAFISNEIENRLKEEAKNGNLTSEKRIANMDGQRELLFNSLLRPELNRILNLSKNNAFENINIKGYEETNLKFYGIPFLNTLDFRYKDGIVENGLDTEGKLLQDLGLEAGQNLFIENNDDLTAPKVLDAAVLSNDSVQQFLMDKVIYHLGTKVEGLKQEMITKDLLVKNENDKYNFKKGKNIDLQGIVDGYKSINSVAATNLTDVDNLYSGNTLVDYIFNSAIAYANMQQMLVGDPIQFADNKASSKILKQIKQLEAEQILLETSKESRDIINKKSNSINDKITKLRTEYETTWAKKDVVNTFGNQSKRLAGDNASGEMILAEEGESTFNLLMIADHNTKSSFLDYYNKVFKEAGNDEETTSKLANSYSDIDTADGQELTSLNEYLKILVAQAELSKEEALEIMKADEAGNLSIKKFGQILTSMKLVYSNNFMRDGVNSRLYIKSSSFPLSKTFTKGLPIDELRKFMDKPENKIDRVAFGSAIKVGSIKTLPKVFNDDTSINLKAINLDKHLISVPREGHKKQQNVPYDGDKTKISDGTQKSKMIFMNVLDTEGFVHPDTGNKVNGRELYSDYIDTINEYYQRKYFKLKDKITVDNQVNLPRLHALLQQEAFNRGYSLNDMKFLELNNEGDAFAYPLWLSSNQEKIESLLNSIVDNGVRKRKRRGISKVLVTDAIIDITKQSDSNIVFLDKNRTEALRPMREDPETGKMLPAEIIITFPFKDNYGRALDINDFLNEDGTLDTEKLPEELLESLAFRIPTQGLNSMAVVKIVGFLPANVDNVVFAPKDFVTQMGSDFDVDKLYGDLQNTLYNTTTKSLRKLEKKDYQNHKDVRKYINKKKDLDKLDALIESTKNNPTIPKSLTIRRKDKAYYIEKDLEVIRNGRTETEMLEEYFNGVNELDIKYLENKMLDFQKAVLMNPHSDIQAQRIQPIDNVVLLEMKNDILPIVSKGEVANNWSAFDPIYQIGKYKGARSGKDGVSSFSSDAVANTVYQTVKASIHFTQVVKNQKQTVTFKIFGKKSNALNNPKTIDGKILKSDIIQALQSISVDNASLLLMDDLGITTKTFDFIRAAVQTGYNAKDILYILNHPIIKAFTKAQEDGTKFELPYKNETDVEEAMMAISEATHEDALNDINNGSYNFDDPFHLGVYYTFAQLTNRGKQLKQVEGLIGIDSVGLGSNLFYSLEKEKAFEELHSNPYFNNMHKIVGERRIDFDLITSNRNLVDNKNNSKEDLIAYNDAKKAYAEDNQKNGYVTNSEIDYWFKPTSIAGIVYWRALKFNNNLWSTVLPYNKPHIQSIVESIADLERNKDTDIFTEVKLNEDLKDRLESSKEYKQKFKTKDFINDITTIGISKVKQQALKEYKSFLFSSIASLDGYTATELRDKFFDNNYLANIIAEIKKNNLLPNNRFINKLNFNKVSRMSDALNISFNSSAKESFDDETLLMDMINIIESDQSVAINGQVIAVKDIAKMLIQHQMVNGGLQEAIQFIKYIPVPYLHNIGLYNLMNNNSFQEDNEDVFIEQYIQHHPESVFSAGLDYDIANKSEKSVFEHDLEAGIITKKGDQYNRNNDNPIYHSNSYVSIKSGDSFILFKRSPFNMNTYLRIPTLGESRIKEYDASPNAGTASSIFKLRERSYPGANIQVYEDSLNKGYNLTELTTEFKKLIELGNTNPTDENAIVKVCK